jgi:NADPH:quinone reductase
MRRIQFEKFGDPAEVLHMVEVAKPTPGPDEVVVRLSARPIHPADLLTVMGLYGIRPKLPITPGLEGAGTVSAVGENVKDVFVGERVVPIIALRETGSWQEFIAVPSTRVIQIPDGLDDAAAAQTVVGPLSSWLMLNEYSNPKAGDWVIQNAASGAMGRFNREVAAGLGLRVINVVRRSDVADELRRDGSEFVIDSSVDDVPALVKEWTDGRGVNVALDALGGESGGELLQTVAAHGVHLLYGALSYQALPVPVGRPIFSELRIQGFWVDFWLRQTAPDKQQPVLRKLLELMAKGDIVPQIGPSYELNNFAEAMKRSAAPDGQPGKICLVG